MCAKRLGPGIELDEISVWRFGETGDIETEEMFSPSSLPFQNVLTLREGLLSLNTLCSEPSLQGTQSFRLTLEY